MADTLYEITITHDRCFADGEKFFKGDHIKVTPSTARAPTTGLVESLGEGAAKVLLELNMAKKKTGRKSA